MEDFIREFLNNYDYDIRKSKNGRWLDQKCTMDVLSVIADCIIEYLGDDTDKIFKPKDIRYNKYTVDNVRDIFNKPTPKQKDSKEYDKWFSQPLKLLGNSKVLIETKKGGRNFYKVNNIEILKYIASRDRYANKFLVLYITKVLKDSDIYEPFKEFFEFQNKEYYQKLRKEFFDFIKNNTKINKDLECGRIFTKVVNPLAYDLKKKGTEGGHISSSSITLDKLMYNRPNWRDIASKKPKEITRKEYEIIYAELQKDKMSTYKINKAKKDLRKYNEKYRNGLSEVKDNIDNNEKATHMHHIFTVSEYPIISANIENIIALTPTQHFNHAHINGKTTEIDYNYQKLCITEKILRIKENFEDINKPNIYNFEDLCYVLNTGFNTNKFDDIKDMDFETLLKRVEEMYN